MVIDFDNIKEERIMNFKPRSIMTEQLKLCEKAKCITALRDILIIWKTIQVATSATWHCTRTSC